MVYITSYKQKPRGYLTPVYFVAGIYSDSSRPKKITLITFMAL